MPRPSPGPLLLASLPLLWVVASAGSKAHGLLWFLAGLGILAAGTWSFRRGERVVLYRIFLLLLLACVTVLPLETLLRFYPGIVHGAVANDLFSGYHVYAGGIYDRNRHMGYAMRPGVRERIYSNGHWWWHTANPDGYRGPALARADAVFLGDSLVYGHGLEADATVPARFAHDMGLSAANLGQQGTCLVHAWMILRDKGLRLRPRTVFACSHPNDLSDATDFYAPEELRSFLASPGPTSDRPIVRDRDLWPRPWWDPFDLWSRHLALPLHCSGILGSLTRAARRGTLRLGAPSRPSRFIPAQADLDAPFAPLTPRATQEDALRWQVHRQAVGKIKGLCDAISARLVLFDLGYPRAFSAAIEELARETGAAYSPAGRVVLARALAGEDLYLSDDGHWNAAGAEGVAHELAASVTGHGGLSSP